MPRTSQPRAYPLLIDKVRNLPQFSRPRITINGLLQKMYLNVKRLSCYDSIPSQLECIYQVNVRILTQRIHAVHNLQSVPSAPASIADIHPPYPILRPECLKLLIWLLYSTNLALLHNHKKQSLQTSQPHGSNTKKNMKMYISKKIICCRRWNRTTDLSGLFTSLFYQLNYTAYHHYIVLCVAI